MSSEGEFEINSLDRFTKRSQRLIMEEPCEIPAGCGGLVFRWIDGESGVPLRLATAAMGDVTVYLNGEMIERTKSRVSFGDLVVGCRVVQPASSEQDSDSSYFDWFMIEADHYVAGWDLGEGRNVSALSSADDGSWLATVVEPDDHWLRADYVPRADQGWTPLVASTMPLDTLDSDDRSRWRFQFMRIAAPLALPDASSVWIRKQITLER